MSVDEAYALRVEGLSKRFPPHPPAIDRIAFSVRPGELVAVLGPSGAGKTTLFRCVAGLARADEGSIEVYGRDGLNRRRPWLRSARCDVAVIFQQFNLIRRMTALENVLAGGLARVPSWRVFSRAFPTSERDHAVRCLETVGLQDRAEQRADRLSGGQQQRVAIARALFQRARLLLADEPVASLDPESAAIVLALLQSIARGGMAVVAALHQVELATRYADRILALNRGALVIDTPAHALEAADIRRIYRD